MRAKLKEEEGSALNALIISSLPPLFRTQLLLRPQVDPLRLVLMEPLSMRASWARTSFLSITALQLPIQAALPLVKALLQLRASIRLITAPLRAVSFVLSWKHHPWRTLRSSKCV